MSPLFLSVALAQSPVVTDVPELAELVVHDPGDAVQSLVSARPFQLDRSMRDTMRAGAPEVRQGWLVQLTVQPDFARVTQARMPVLYAGDTPARIFWSNPVTGCVVAMVPGERDLSEVVFFYGSKALPERVDGARGAAELSAARAKGLGPREAAEVAAAVSAGGPELVGDEDALWAAAEQLSVSACHKPVR
jgi:hypothetical protein